MHQRTLLPQRPVWQLIINKSNHTNITIQGSFYLMTTFLVKGSRTISFGRNIKKAYCLSLSRQKIVLDWQDLSAYWGFVSLIWLVSNFQSCYTSVWGGGAVRVGWARGGCWAAKEGGNESRWMVIIWWWALSLLPLYFLQPSLPLLSQNSTSWEYRAYLLALC